MNDNQICTPLRRQTAPDIVCLSHLRWDGVFQRPQHLMVRASRDRRVFIVEEPIAAAGSPGCDITEPHPNVWRVVPQMTAGAAPDAVLDCQRTAIDTVMAAHAIRNPVLWYYTPMALPVTRHLAPSVRVYDCMDELSAFAGAPPALAALERELLDVSDIVFTGGYSLYEAKRARHPRVHAFPSSVDVDHFAVARRPCAEPPDQRAIPYPRCGYFGVVDERIDLGLLASVAAARPNWQFVMVGPVTKIDPGALPQATNIHYLGAKRYEQLPSYIAGWRVAMMPFARNDATRYISPTKTPEYLAAGKPVVSTPIHDVVRAYGTCGIVRIAADAPSFAAAIDESVQDDPRVRLVLADACLEGRSWDQTWAAMDGIVMRAIAVRQPSEASHV